jgi:hypothetical protein
LEETVLYLDPHPRSGRPEAAAAAITAAAAPSDVKAKSYFNSGVHVVENNFQQPLSGSLSPNSMEVMRMSLAGKAAAMQLNGSYIGEEVKYSTLDWPPAASRRFSVAERGR